MGSTTKKIINIFWIIVFCTINSNSFSQNNTQLDIAIKSNKNDSDVNKKTIVIYTKHDTAKIQKFVDSNYIYYFFINNFVSTFLKVDFKGNLISIQNLIDGEPCFVTATLDTNSNIIRFDVFSEKVEMDYYKFTYDDFGLSDEESEIMELPPDLPFESRLVERNCYSIDGEVIKRIDCDESYFLLNIPE